MPESLPQGEPHTFTTADGTIAYEVIQSEETTSFEPTTLTLLHNFMSTGRMAWGPMLAKFAERYRILLPDLPGHGQSIGYPEDFHYGTIAKQLVALMKKENAANGHLAGCSAGGMIAQRMVIHEDIRPKTLTLISTTYSINEEVTGANHTLKPENFKAGQRWMEATAELHDPYHYSGYYQEKILPAFRRLEPALAIDLPLNALETLQMPVCLIHGSEDEFFPKKLVEEMASAIPQSQLHLIPGQPHALIFRQPWRIQEIMTNFLA